MDYDREIRLLAAFQKDYEARGAECLDPHRMRAIFGAINSIVSKAEDTQKRFSTLLTAAASEINDDLTIIFSECQDIGAMGSAIPGAAQRCTWKVGWLLKQAWKRGARNTAASFENLAVEEVAYDRCVF